MNGAWDDFLRQEGASFHEAPEAEWEFSAPAAPAAAQAATMAALPYLEIIDAHGRDAPAFLHAQFCGDILGLSQGGCRFTAWCNARGRVITTLYVVRLDDDRFRLFLPRSLLEPVCRRLGMFVLRDAVQLHAQSGALACVGLTGAGSAATDAGFDLAVDGESRVRAGLVSAPFPGTDGQRHLVCGAPADLIPLWAALRSRAAAVGTRRWRRADIDAGLAWLSAATSEQFLPQELNLDQMDGLSYTKGCYPGQEVIARVRYRGRLRNRLCRITLSAGAPPVPGTPLHRGQTRVGTLIGAVPEAEGRQSGLAVVELEAANAPGIRLGDDAGASCRIEALARAE